jgi:hypothetical protein
MYKGKDLDPLTDRDRHCQGNVYTGETSMNGMYLSFVLLSHSL